MVHADGRATWCYNTIYVSSTRFLLRRRALFIFIKRIYEVDKSIFMIPEMDNSMLPGCKPYFARG